MIKKIVLICLTAASFLFFSCNSTDVENPEVIDELTAVEEETDTTSENDISTDESESQTEENDTSDESHAEVTSENEASEFSIDESLSEESESENNQQLVSEQFPALEEIIEPEIIDVSIEEIIQQELELQKLLEAEMAKGIPEEEKVSEIDVLTPIEIIENEKNSINNNDETNSKPAAEITESINTQPESDLNADNSDNTQNIENIEENQTEEENLEPEEVIVPSRSVTLRKGETLSVTYPGNGWIYMGSTDEYNNLASRGRKLGSTDTKYTLLAKEPGTQIHHFYKVDNLTGEYIDDYLEVIVLDKKGSSSTVVTAPEYKEIVPHKPSEPAKSTATKNKEKAEKEAALAEETSTSEKTAAESESKKEATETKKAESTSKTNSSKSKKQEKEEINYNNDDDIIFLDEEDDSEVIAIPDYDEATISQFFTDAKNNYKNKKYSDAFTQINTYLELSTENRDEALYILAQIYENDSKLKDIKKAINTYQLLCDNYPASSYWDAANKRIIYLNRFYINIH